jgi:hypothetical protein
MPPLEGHPQLLHATPHAAHAVRRQQQQQQQQQAAAAGSSRHHTCVQAGVLSDKAAVPTHAATSNQLQLYEPSHPPAHMSAVCYSCVLLVLLVLLPRFLGMEGARSVKQVTCETSHLA